MITTKEIIHIHIHGLNGIYTLIAFSDKNFIYSSKREITKSLPLDKFKCFHGKQRTSDIAKQFQKTHENYLQKLKYLEGKKRPVKYKYGDQPHPAPWSVIEQMICEELHKKIHKTNLGI